ncbi:MAG TPA: hypothetical protein VKT72_01030 [Candidatus Baltobacteraceae bacterium]|nr:hypothetical protein [Candidatus Baltobacteraceae bacterium]
MADESKTYSNVTRAQVDKLRARLAAYVQLPPGDGGTIESQGMKGSFAYDEAAGTLTLTLDEVPFFIPRGMIWSTIDRALQA